MTGHTGFKGSWLSLWLESLGAQVTGLALAPTTPSLFEQASVDSGITSVIGTINDAETVERVVAQTEPTIVLHLAAQAIVRASYDDPAATFLTNVVGTANVLNACRGHEGVKAIVSVTSDKCYENREWDWGYRESEPMGGHDPYSASKGCAELVTAAMRRSYFDAADTAMVGSARAGNVIGGGDWAENRLLPDIVRAFSQGEEVVIRSPEAVRPWQHVLEPLSGYLLLAQELASTTTSRAAELATGWNFGPADTDARPVEWIVERMASRWGPETSWRVERGGPHEATMLKLDCSKARNQLHWEPRLELDETLDWLVDWYKAEQAGSDMRAFTLAQIQAFDALSPSA